MRLEEANITNMMQPNWVFKLYSRVRIHYVLFAFLLCFLLLTIGLLLFLILGAFREFLSNYKVFVLISGIFWGLTALGWLTKQYPRTISSIRLFFKITNSAYEKEVRKWIENWATNNLLFLAASAFMVVIGIIYVLILWN